MIGRSLNLVLAPVIALIVAFGWPVSANAACKAWTLATQQVWGIKQSNGYTLGLTFKQSGGLLSGNGYYYPVGQGGGARTQGSITGSVDGNEFHFTMKWSNGGKGLYTGFVAKDGTISGNTRDAKDRNSRATWYAVKSQKARCLA